MKKLIVMMLLGVCGLARADLANQLSELTGYTILGSTTIVARQDENKAREDGFEGCNYGRKILFNNDRYLTCRSYHYHYAYRPTAVLLGNGSQIKMIVDDDVYDMSKF